MELKDYVAEDATGLAGLVAAGEVSAAELTERTWPIKSCCR